MSVEVHGLPELLKQMGDMSIVLRVKYLKAAVKRGGQLIRELMAHKAPVFTGKLQSDIIISVRETIGAEGVAEIGPSKATAWRARFIEYGTRAHLAVAQTAKILVGGEDGSTVFGTQVRIPALSARPFMRPAYDEGIDQAQEIIGAFIMKALETEFGK